LGGCLLEKQVNTRSLFDIVDVLVTCGGTAGMEFPCFGVPVLVAAKPPYASYPFVVSPGTLAGYFAELDRIHTYGRLNPTDAQTASAVLYVTQCLMQVEKNGIGLGSQPYLLGVKFDRDLFLREMIQDCSEGSGYHRLVAAMETFVHGEPRNLLDWDKLGGGSEDDYRKASGLQPKGSPLFA
jgi:hypothetical protein